MAEETKPVVIPATETVEPTPAVEAPVVSEPVVDAKPAETVAEDAKVAETPAVEEAKAEPIYEGALKYTSGSAVKALFQKPSYKFWFGSEEKNAPAEDLKHTVKLQEEGGRHTAAWSQETGAGILYYVRDAANHSGPPGAILLHAIEDLKKTGTEKLQFKLHGSNHTLSAKDATERDGWYTAFETKIEEAKALKDDIINRSSYKETLEKLVKPTPLVLGTAAAKTDAVQENIPKKSEERKARQEAKKEAKPAKDRSQSRGKKLFGAILGKKEAKAAEETPAEEGEASTAPVVAAEPAEPVEEKVEAPAETAEPAVAVLPAPIALAEEAKPEDKKARRSSKLFDRFRSTKKPEETTAAATTTETPAVDEAPKIEEDVLTHPEPTSAEPAPVTEDATVLPLTEEAKPEETKAEEKAEESAAVPAEKVERRRSLFDFTNFKLNKGKKTETTGAAATSPSEEAPAVEESKVEEPVATEAAETPKVETPKEETPAKKGNNLVDLLRSKSKAFRGSKKTKAPAAEEAKAEEAAAPVEEEVVAPAVVEKEKSPAIIGDVVPEAVTIGTPAANPTVAATA